VAKQQPTDQINALLSPQCPPTVKGVLDHLFF